MLFGFYNSDCSQGSWAMKKLVASFLILLSFVLAGCAGSAGGGVGAGGVGGGTTTPQPPQQSVPPPVSLDASVQGTPKTGYIVENNFYVPESTCPTLCETGSCPDGCPVTEIVSPPLPDFPDNYSPDRLAIEPAAGDVARSAWENKISARDSNFFCDGGQPQPGDSAIEHCGVGDPYYTFLGTFELEQFKNNPTPVVQTASYTRDYINVLPITSPYLTHLSYERLEMLDRRVQSLSDNTDTTIDVPLPPKDIRTAWYYGWTGLGTNVLILDDFVNTHGFSVALSTLEVAPGAGLLAFEAGLAGGVRLGRYGLRGLADNRERSGSTTRIDVINQSFGYINPGIDNATLSHIRESALFRMLNLDGQPLTGSDCTTFAIWCDTTEIVPALNSIDAVITKAAGNEFGADAGLYPLNYLLVTDSQTSERVLIVGALDKYAQEGGAEIAYYSSRAGANPDVRERFLVEYGGTPYDERVVLCDRAVSGVCSNPDTNLGDRIHPQGTSFAAPRVAGFAAILRQKFPNLSGIETANILLNTATYDGLSCGAACDPGIYGRGRVDILRALSPTPGDLN